MDKILTNIDILRLISERKIDSKAGARLFCRIKNGEKIMISSLEERVENSLIMYTNYQAESDFKQGKKESIRQQNLLMIFIKEVAEKEQILNSVKDYKYVVSVENGRKLRTEGFQYEVDYSKEEQVVQLFEVLREKKMIPNKIVFLMGGTYKKEESAMKDMLEELYYPVVRMIKASFLQKWNQHIDVYFAYENQKEASPEFAAFNGFGRTIMLENSRFSSYTVAYETRTQLAAELSYQKTCENDIVYQGGIRYVNTMKEQESIWKGHSSESRIKTGGVYIITGGNGGVARKFTRYLSQHYHAKLVLAGRSKQNPSIDAYVEELGSLGGEAVYVSADCTKLEEAVKIVETSIDRYGSVDGIIHSAGVMLDSYLYKKDVAESYKVLEPKILGCINMDEASKRCDLDFFMVFSSTAGVYGNAGQADYAYANNFMDHYMSLREQRRKNGERKGQSIAMNWPLWKNAGMNVDEETLKNMVKRSGIAPIDMTEATIVFENGIRMKENQLISITGDMKRIKKEVKAVFGEYESMETPIRTLKEDNHTEVEKKELSKEELLESISGKLIKITSSILDIAEEMIDASDDMQELGFDSISQTTLANQINDIFSTAFLPTLFFELEESSLLGLAEYLIANEYDRIMEFFRAEKSEVVEVEKLQKVEIDEPTIELEDNKVVVDEGDVLEHLIQSIKEIVSEILEIEIKEIDENDDMKEQGFDSITQTTFINCINEKFGKSYIVTIFFELEEPTLHGLCEYLLNEDRKTYEAYYNVNANKVSQHAKVLEKEVEIKYSAREKVNERKETADDTEEQGTRFAVVGMDCIMPKADNVYEFWKNVAHKENVITTIPQERVKLHAFTEEEAQKYYGAFVSGVDKFDAAFFGISPHEAEYMDPQQRMILRCTWNAMEDACMKPTDLAKNKTGVFIGSDSLNYIETYQHLNKEEETDPYIVTGMDAAVMAGRVSYIFDFTGPSMNINTACSSSLTAVAQAMDALRLGRCNVAVVGGVNLILDAMSYKALDSAGMLSKSGKCSTFDEKADGYVRGEGCGVVILKRLEDAIKENDNIHAVLCGYAVNHGGKANSLTAPNMLQQTQLIVEAMEDAKVKPEQIGYVEAHGTGTRLGDPVEINGLKRAFHALGIDRSLKNTCAVGTVKTNIGHLEAAAGMAGLIKTIMALKEKKIPGMSYFKNLNRNILLEDSPFYISKETKDWEVPVKDGKQQLRYACVSSFGFGGSNVHLVLREYHAEKGKSKGNVQWIPISAKSETALKKYVEKLRKFLQADNEELNFDSVAYSLQCGREEMPYRVVFHADSIQSFIKVLSDYGNQIPNECYMDNLKKEKHTFVPEWNADFAQNWIEGKHVDWESLWDDEKPMKISLPTYCFDEKSFWIGSFQKKKEDTEGYPKKKPAGENHMLKLKKESYYKESINRVPERKALVLNRMGKKGDAVSVTADNMQEETDKEIKNQIVSIAAKILYLTEDELSEEIPLRDYGLDSIGGVELIDKLNQKFQIQLKTIDIYDYPAIQDLADHICEIADVPIVSSKTAQNVRKEDGLTTGVTEKADKTTSYEEEKVKLEKQNEYNSSDIAVIGMSLKAPKADNIEEFWRVLRDGVDCIVEIPEDRWEMEGFYDADSTKPHRSYCKWGGFLNGIAQFDPLFFRMTPSEAEVIEPQQRLFLEESYKALEMAGYTGKRVSGKKCGVYVGIGTANDYHCLDNREVENDEVAHAMLGSAGCVLAARISYFLNLKGPAIAMDTACSSSHVAIHMACEALRSGQIEMAVAGGVTIEITKNRHIYTSKSGALSHDGRCKTFDESADGYVPSEGVGAVVLKRLDQAVQDRDCIYGVIKASEVNQDGTTNGITAPSAESQYKLEVETYEKYHINPRNISYVEAHGTGTKLGDPIEVSALTRAFRQYTDEKGYCAIGSVKTNVGHSSAASGVTALIKVLLSMKNGKIPKSLHYHDCNKQIDFLNSPFYVPQQLMDWKKGNGRNRQAAISGFGLSGTNCHMVVEEWEEPSRVEDDKNSQIIVLSALTKKALVQQMKNLYEYVSKHSDVTLRDVSYTLTVARNAFRYRSAFTVDSLEELKEVLKKKISEQDRILKQLKPSVNKKNCKKSVVEKLNRKDLVSQYSQRERKNLLNELAESFMDGYEMEWTGLYGEDAHTIELPSYPFERDSYWFEERKKIAEDAMDGRIVEVEREEESGRYTFECKVDGTEFYLTDHVINGQKVFPAVSYLELVNASAKKIFGREVKAFRNVVLAKPIIVGDSSVIIKIQFVKWKNAYEFSISTVNGTQVNWHAQGIVEETESVQETKYVDKEEFKHTYTELIPRESVYKYFDDVNVSYGPCFKTILKIYHAEGEALSEVALNEKCQKNLYNYFFHPALMDAMFQTTTGIMSEDMFLHNDRYSGLTFMPFVLGSVNVLGDPRKTKNGYVKVKAAKEGKNNICRLDINMLDEDGKVLVEIVDFYARAITKEDVDKKDKNPLRRTVFDRTKVNSSVRYFKHDKVQKAFSVKKSKDCMLLIEKEEELYKKLKESKEDTDRLIRIQKENATQLWNKLTQIEIPMNVLFYLDADNNEGLEDSLYSMYHIVKYLIMKKNKYNIIFLYKVDTGTFALPYCQAMRAFAKTINKESSKVYVKCVEIDDSFDYTGCIDRMISETECRGEEQVYYKKGKRYEYRIGAVALEEMQEEPPILDNGVYVITGGIGKIGMAFAKYLAENYGVSIVVTGRKQLTQERFEEIEHLNAEGLDIRYVQSDVSEMEDCRKLLRTVKDWYGKVNGVIHAAGILKDAAIFNKTFEDMKLVISAKVTGLIHLYETFKQENLDLFVCFSAIAAMVGNVGQCDYAYANCFMDSFMEVIKKQGTFARVLSLEWPLWKNGGMQLDARMEDSLKNSEMVPLATEDGLDVFEMALRSKETALLGIHIKSENFEFSTMSYQEEKTETPCEPVQTTIQWKSTESVEKQLEKALTNIICLKLKLNEERFESSMDLGDYGIDSITITSLTDVLNGELGFKMLPTVFFELDTMSVECLTQYILENYRKEAEKKFPCQQKEMVVEEYKSMEKEEWEEQENIEKMYKQNDIAIIGIAGKMPDCSSMDEFWIKLSEGDCMVKEIPRDRFDWNQCVSGKEEGVKEAALMKDVDRFDADFFHISRREAELMDPQQRIMLELTWNLFEDAGYSPNSMAYTETGVFLGISNADYNVVVNACNAGMDQMCATGLSHAITANRISYFYGLNGPSEVINTACSSSLLAVHRACRAIQDEECSMALAGGISTILSSTAQEMYGKMGVLSESGICAPFDKSADGIMRGEGAGIVLLKKLSDAQRDGDYIYAVIKGTAVNHGGKVSSLTVPSKEAQEKLIRKAVENAGIAPNTISYIECHGTGTKLGDPIEVDGIKSAFSKMGRQKESGMECGLGSVKSNIGHLEASSGIAGMLKVILSMQHRMIPASIHFKEINPYIRLEDTPFYIVDQKRDWNTEVDAQGNAIPRRAGISSFGLGGSNVHVILEEYAMNYEAEQDEKAHIIVLSAKNDKVLKEYAKKLLEFVKTKASENCDFMERLAWSLQNGRTKMEHCMAIVCTTKEELLKKLKAFLGQTECIGVYAGTQAEESMVELDYGSPDAIAEAWVKGSRIQWERLHQKLPVNLPTVTYPFERKRYWVQNNEIEEAVKELPKAPDKKSKCEYLKPVWHTVKPHGRVGSVEKLVILYNGAGKKLANEVYDTNFEAESELIYLSNRDKQFPDGSWEIDCAKEKILESCISEIPDVVYLILGGENKETEESGTKYISSGEKYAVLLLKLVKELQQLAVGKKIRLHVITDRAFARTGEMNENPDMAVLYGIVKSASYEYADIQFQYYDVDFDNCAPEMFQFTEENVAETPLLVRNHTLYARKLEYNVKTERKRIHFQEGGVYLILGGMKGIGYEISKYLAEKYHANLILTGRSALTEEMESKLKQLGNQAKYRLADVGEYAQMQKVITYGKTQYGKINGIINSTGVLCDKLIKNLSSQELLSVLKSKVTGNLILDKLLDEADADFVMIFSSAASFTGSAGRSAYTAASNGADQIAHHMTMHQNTKVFTVNWSFWNNIGMKLSDSQKERLEREGISGLDVEEGMEAIEYILSTQETQIAVAKEKSMRKQERKITHVTEKIDVRSYIGGCLCETLKLEEEELDDGRAFSDYGVDSMLGVEIAEKIKEGLNIELRATDLINYPNLKNLTAHIRGKLGYQEQSWETGIEAKQDNAEDMLLKALYQLSNGEVDSDKVAELLQ